MDLFATYAELLKELDFRPQRTQSGNLSFKYDGRTFTIILYEDDPGFFQILYSGIWKIDSPEGLREAFDACSQLTSGKKVAKAFVEPDRSYVSASVELFVTEPGAVRPLFMRSLNTLEAVGRELRERLWRGAEERTSAQLRALVRRRLFEVLTDGDVTGVKVLFTDDYVCVDPATPAGGWPAGPVAAIAHMTTYRGAFSSFRLTLHHQHVAGSVVTTRWSLTGRQNGPLLGLPPCGQEVTLMAISVDELRGAQIAYTTTAYDCGQIARHLLRALQPNLSVESDPVLTSDS